MEFLQQPHEGVLVVAILLEALIVGISALMYAFLSFRVIRAHKGDPNYKRTPTVIWFNYFFILMGLLCLSIALNFFIDVFLLVIIISTLLTFVSVITVIQYAKQMDVFTEKQIPKELHQQQLQSLKSKFNRLNISEELRSEIVGKIDKISA